MYIFYGKNLFHNKKSRIFSVDYRKCIVHKLNAKTQNPISNCIYFTAIPLAHLDGLNTTDHLRLTNRKVWYQHLKRSWLIRLTLLYIECQATESKIKWFLLYSNSACTSGRVEKRTISGQRRAPIQAGGHICLHLELPTNLWLTLTYLHLTQLRLWIYYNSD